MSRIKELRQRKTDLLTEAEMLAKLEDDGSITAEQTERLDAIADQDGEITKVNRSIAREERLMDERRAMDAVEPPAADTDVEVVQRVSASVTGDRPVFESFGQQLQAIAHSDMNKGGPRDDRLVWEAAAGANEAVPSEGGFLVQQQFSTELLDEMHDLGDLLSRVRRIPITVGNGIKLPAIDETSRANGSRFGGVQAYWANEADTVNESKPKFRELDLRLNKLMGVGYTTDELLADASALEAIMRTAFVEELTFKTEDATINGTGSGQMLGVLNSGAVVSVAKEAEQDARTIVTQNVLNMWSRLPIRTRRNAVWLINQDIETQLYQLTLGNGTAVVLLYTPPGVNGNTSPYGLLLGRPVIPVEYCATLGTNGDMILMDPMNYVMIDKNGIQQASSMHVRFLYDEMTFRFTYRVDGQPVWRKPVTPYKGANTLSPYVTLADRT